MAGVWLGLLVLAGMPRVLPAQGAAKLTAPAFAAELVTLQHLAQSCAGNADACDVSKVPTHQQVEGGPGGSFAVTWNWFADALTTAKGAKPADRTSAMQAAQLHLSELAAEASAGPSVPPADFSRARSAANKALARDEFRAAEGPTWLERKAAKLQDWILRLFTGMDRLGKRAPWIAPLIEWGCFALAAGGLLWFVRQSLQRQALRISLGEGTALAGQGQRESADWARLAASYAEEADWREAIHCLYWAAIALLEARRAWKPNATRTPREYVRLLRSGSESQGALRQLTGTLERVWYGHADADEGQYRLALDSYRLLETARPERASAGNSQENTARPSEALAGGL